MYEDWVDFRKELRATREPTKESQGTKEHAPRTKEQEPESQPRSKSQGAKARAREPRGKSQGAREPRSKSQGNQGPIAREPRSKSQGAKEQEPGSQGRGRKQGSLAKAKEPTQGGRHPDCLEWYCACVLLKQSDQFGISEQAAPAAPPRAGATPIAWSALCVIALEAFRTVWESRAGGAPAAPPRSGAIQIAWSGIVCACF